MWIFYFLPIVIKTMDNLLNSLSLSFLCELLLIFVSLIFMFQFHGSYIHVPFSIIPLGNTH